MTTQSLDNNPANSTTEKQADIAANRPPRIPMSTPRRKLEVPEIPGYHCHWFLESNIIAAQQGWYEFVHTDEVAINSINVGTAGNMTGNADLGTRVCVLGNKTSESGKPEMLYLMKIKEEYYQEDQKADDDRDAAILSGIFRDEKIQGAEKDSAEDRGTRYVRKDLSVFQRPARKG